MSAPDASQNHSAKEEQRSSVATPPGKKSGQKIARVRRCMLSERAVRGLEVTILTLPVIYVVGLLSVPSALYFWKTVSASVTMIL